ncbi:MAG TPA: Clp protease ClpP, partial [Mycobacterium sp.]|nr:Clp protease ClpP [Mycobacterium sp.]
MLIYDEIDSWYGVSAEALAREISSLDDSRELHVRINSPGGNIFDGVAILNALRGHPGKVTVFVDSLAASAASFLAMGGDEIVMNRDSEMMIHKGHGLVVGGADDMRQQADLIDRLNDKIAGIYAERAGGSVEDWLAIMDAETWYSAEEAVEAGLADRVETATADRDQAAAKFDLSIFAHAGRAHAPAPRFPKAHNRTSTESPVEAEKKEGPVMATLSESALQKLGL